jgi:hypothetical protein
MRWAGHVARMGGGEEEKKKKKKKKKKACKSLVAKPE